MRILYLVDHWPGLFEAYLFREIEWMRNRGHNVAVVSLGSGGPHGFRRETGGYVNLSRFGLEDIPVLQLDSRQTPADRIVSEALAFAHDYEFEIVDAHLAREPAEVACDMHLANGIPFTVRMRGGDVHTNTSPRLAEIVEHAAAVCPMSQFLADILTGKRLPNKIPQQIPVQVDPDKLHVIPNSLPVKYLSKTAANQSNDIQIVGAIGRAVPVKRFRDLIEAVAALANDFPGLRLMIIGGGVMAAELQATAESLGLGERFEITGFRSWSEVMDLTRQLHIYVQCSELEGCSLANIEAGFQGIPLVLSRTGANEQCVDSGENGYLFDSGDLPALQEHLRSVLESGADGRKRMGTASLEIVGQRFSAEKIMPGIEHVFQAAIAARMLPAALVNGFASHSGGMI
jgi:glycosyltransferase involved in cell wall biosynthesis